MPSACEVCIRASSKGQSFTIWEVRASNIGQLVKISGIVTHCLDVKPVMKLDANICGNEATFYILVVYFYEVGHTGFCRKRRRLTGRYILGGYVCFPRVFLEAFVL
ncbi:DNA replication licensing factor MCM7, partial [Tanacetum coccineum]